MSKVYNYSTTIEWVDLNTLTGFDIGSNFIIQNTGGNYVFIYVSEVQPDNDEVGFVLTTYSSEGSTYTVDWDARYTVWVRSVKTSTIAVQLI